jgi:hypothetical protein
MLPMQRESSVTRLHLENFVNAVIGKEKLHCSGEDALVSHLLAWEIDKAAESGKTAVFKDGMFGRG